MLKLRKKLRNHNGQVLVEMALMLPVLLIVLFGIIEFGRIFTTYLVVSNASREGARLAALSAVESIDLEGEVKDFIASTGLCTRLETETKVDIDSTLIKDEDLDGDGIDDNVTYSKAERESGDRVLVEVKYDLDLITPIVGPLIDDDNSGDFDIVAYTQMRVE